MEIKENLTLVNFTKGRTAPISHIVLHFTANDKDTGEGNSKYFKTVNRQASAHYFVDENSITRVVKDCDTSWHCGDTQKYTNGGAQFKNKCFNSNSIGIEMCSDKINGDYVITDQTQANTIELVRDLMKQYAIPLSNVILHYDVTGKICPEPFVMHGEQWNEFKDKLVEHKPHWAQVHLNSLISKGLIKNPELHKSNLDSPISAGELFAILDRMTK